MPVSLRLPTKLTDNVDAVKKAIFKCVDATYMHFPVLKKAAEYSTSSKGRLGRCRVPCVAENKNMYIYCIQPNSIICSNDSVTKSTNITITFGSTAMDCQKVVENILGGVPAAVGKLRNGWRDVLALVLKTPFSAALPFYSSVPGDAALQALQPKTVPQLSENDKSGTEGAAKVSAKSPLKAGKKAEKKAAAKKKESTASSDVKEPKEVPKQPSDEESKDVIQVTKDADSTNTKKKAVVIKQDKGGEKPSSGNPKKRKSSDSTPPSAPEEYSTVPEALPAKEAPQDTEKEVKAVSKRSKGAAKEMKEAATAENPPILDLAQAEAALQALESELATKKKAPTSNKKEEKKKLTSSATAPVPVPLPTVPVAVVATAAPVASPAAEVSVAATGRVTRSRSRSNSMASDSGDESGKVVKMASKPAKAAMPPIAEEVEVTDRKRKTPSKKAIEPAAASEGTPAAPKRRRGEAEEPAAEKVVEEERPKVDSKQPLTKADKKVKAADVGEPAVATRKRSKSSSAKGE